MHKHIYNLSPHKVTFCSPKNYPDHVPPSIYREELSISTKHKPRSRFYRGLSIWIPEGPPSLACSDTMRETKLNKILMSFENQLNSLWVYSQNHLASSWCYYRVKTD